MCPGLGDACTGCMSAACAGVYCNCYNEPHCGGYLECRGLCTQEDTACLQNCAAVHEPGISAAVLTAHCAATACDESCMFGLSLDDCQACLYTECDEPMNACLANPECVALIQCFQTCPPGDMACGSQCAQEHPAGTLLAQSIRMCRLAECDGICP